MAFAAAPEYHVFPTRERPLTPYQAVERATRETVALVRDVAPDVVISDILTLAPALAGELEGVPVGTVIPHLDPRMPDGSAPYSCGARLPRTRAGRALWRGADPLLRHGLQLGRASAQRDAPAARAAGAGARPRRDQRGADARRDVPPARVPAGVARRARTSSARSCGSRRRRTSRRPPGAEPLVLIAPSTSQDPGQTLLRAALEGLAGLPVRVLASANRQIPAGTGGAAQRPARRLGLLRARDAGLRSRRLPRRARHRGARAGEWLRGRDRAGRRRHERERRARGLGGRRRAAARAPSWARAGSRSPSAARSPGRRCARAPAACRPGRSATTEPCAPPTSSRTSRGGPVGASGVARAGDERAVDAPHTAAPAAV